MRARYPDIEGHVVRDGVQLGYEIFGSGEPIVLLLPTWTIVHARFWKMQIPYLSRFYRVIAYDGPGNGRSGRVTDPQRYSADAYADSRRAGQLWCRSSRGGWAVTRCGLRGQVGQTCARPGAGRGHDRAVDSSHAHRNAPRSPSDSLSRIPLTSTAGTSTTSPTGTTTIGISPSSSSSSVSWRPIPPSR